MSCNADGAVHRNPELFLGYEQVDEQYLTRNWPTQITMSVDEGIIDADLLGYFSCITEGDSFVTGHILHYRELVYRMVTTKTSRF